MTRRNGHSDNGSTGLVENLGVAEADDVSTPVLPADALQEAATRSKQRARQPIQQNRFVIIAAGAVVTAILIFVAVFIPHRNAPQKTQGRAATKTESTIETSNEGAAKSLFPITDSGRPAVKEAHRGFVNESDLQRTAIRSGANTSQVAQPSAPGTLGSIPPFGDK